MAKTLGKTTFLKNLWKKSPELVSGIFQARSIVLVGGKGQVGGGGKMYKLKVIFWAPYKLNNLFWFIKNTLQEKGGFFFICSYII